MIIAGDSLTETLREVRVIELSARRAVQELLAGQYRSVFRGRGIDFDQAREYVPGDDVRSIDWNVTARTGRPFVKEHVEERMLTLMLVVDVSASTDLGTRSINKRKLAARIASVLAFSAIGNADKVGLLLVSDRVERYIPAGKGRRHVLRVIRETLSAQPEGRGTDLTLALETVRRVMRRAGVVFVLSDFLTHNCPGRDLPALEHALLLTRMRHDVVAVRVSDAREEELPDVGVIALEDAETGEVVEVNTGSRAVRESFAALSRTRSCELQDLFRRAGVDQVSVRTDQDPARELQVFFRKRARNLS